MGFKFSASQYKFHFIGIGGIGMSGLAKILLNTGYKVSGSDKNKSWLTEELIKLGAIINYGHSKDNIEDANVIIYSAAIKEDNVEFKEALLKGIPIINRAEMLSELADPFYSIAVTGTHGKTTTATILSKILFDSFFEPTIILGGIAPFIQSNSYKGSGNYSVYEACEAYGSLRYYKPSIAIVTNVDMDHFDYFNSIDEVKMEFNHFIKRIPFYGKIFLNRDDPLSMDIAKDCFKPISFYGINSSDAELRAIDINFKIDSTSFKLLHNDSIVGTITYPLYGLHNVYNILSAISAAIYLNIDFLSIARSLKGFVNSNRRFQLIGEKRNIKIYSDYAHHPTEIKMTISSVRQMKPNSRVVVIFQPHLYSRTKILFSEFAEALILSDFICLLPIYPAREKAIKGITSNLIMESIKIKKPDIKALSFMSREELLNSLPIKLCPNDIILTLGAGDIDLTAYDLLDRL